MVTRREFLDTLATGAAGLAISSTARSYGQILGANERLNFAVIGLNGRGYAHLASLEANRRDARISHVCDVDGKILSKFAETTRKETGESAAAEKDFRQILALEEVDAVSIATPDHWHAPMAIAALQAGKHVYLEKPMTHTNEEARLLVNTVKETKRVLQVGSQTTSADIWWKAKKAIADGMIVKMIMSQGSYHRNSFGGEWNEGWPIDKEAGPEGKDENYLDWNMWLGSAYKLAPKRAYDADRYFRFRKYWDYSGGIATDLFYHVVAPLNICWDEPQFPVKVTGSGGIYEFKDEREVPDTFHLIAEYAKGHSLVLSSTMANSQHIPGLIRGHEGTIIMVDHGMFESMVPKITVKPEVRQGKAVGGDKYAEKFGTKNFDIEIDQKDPMQAHVGNFLECMRTRQKPHLDVETGARAVVVINLAVQSYREGKTLYFDEKHWKASDKPVKS